MSTFPTSALSLRPSRSGSGSLDRLGMVLSSACAVHCMAMPFVVGTLAYLGHGWMASEEAELILFGTAFLIAMASLLPSFLKHRNPAALLLFVLGAGVIGGVHYTGFEHGAVAGLLMALGGSLIAFAHWKNHRLCTCCTRPSHSH